MISPAVQAITRGQIMPFSFGKRSEEELVGVDAGIVRVCRRAIAASPIDFAVHDGLRTIEEQREYVRTGASWTMKSYHLEGLAVDLVPYINGKLRWEWEPIYTIAKVVQAAAIAEGVVLTWGSVWDRRLNKLSNDLEREVQLYVYRRKALGKKAKLDGPHFQGVRP